MKSTSIPNKIRLIQHNIEKQIDQFHLQRYGETIAQRMAYRAEEQQLINALGPISPAILKKFKLLSEKKERGLLANVMVMKRSSLKLSDARRDDPLFIMQPPPPPPPQPPSSPSGTKEYFTFSVGYPNNMSAPLITTAEYGGLGWWDAPPYMVPAIVNNHQGYKNHQLYLWWTLIVPRDGIWWFPGFPSLFMDYTYRLTEGPGLSIDSSLLMQAWANLSLDNQAKLIDYQYIVDDYSRVSTATGEGYRWIPFGGWGYPCFRARKGQYISMCLSLHIWDYASNGIAITHINKCWVMANNYHDFFLIQVG
jgi:hypothetical protein